MFDDKRINFNKRLKNIFRNKISYDILSYSIKEGKRIRPIILLEVYKMLNKDINDDIYNFAIALELIHNYSLVHDDLPSMDNDNYRRGRKTTHYKFGEANAILAGDSLLNYAHEILLELVTKNLSLEYAKSAKYISNASGIDGMIRGQILDINNNLDTEDALIDMYTNKTCKLIMCATTVPAILSNLSEKDVEKFSELGFNIGMAFQLQDDILDIEEDKKIDKKTLINFYGKEKTLSEIERYSESSIEFLSKYEGSEFLIDLIRKLIKRNY